MVPGMSEHTVAVDDIRKALRMGHYRAAFSSLRAMRRLLERVTIEAYEGVRPMRDLVAMSAALKTAAELFVAEKQLVSLGLDKEEDMHPLGADGGLSPDLVPRGYVSRSKSYKKGTGARGTPIDEFKVVEDTGGPDDRPLLEQANSMEEEF
jgi:hypothetical protein